MANATPPRKACQSAIMPIPINAPATPATRALRPSRRRRRTRVKISRLSSPITDRAAMTAHTKTSSRGRCRNAFATSTVMWPVVNGAVWAEAARRPARTRAPAANQRSAGRRMRASTESCSAGSASGESSGAARPGAGAAASPGSRGEDATGWIMYQSIPRNATPSRRDRPGHLRDAAGRVEADGIGGTPREQDEARHGGREGDEGRHAHPEGHGRRERVVRQAGEVTAERPAQVAGGRVASCHRRADQVRRTARYGPVRGDRCQASRHPVLVGGLDDAADHGDTEGPADFADRVVDGAPGAGLAGG